MATENNNNNPHGDIFLKCLGMKASMDLEDDERARMPTIIIKKLAITNPPFYIPLNEKIKPQKNKPKTNNNNNNSEQNKTNI